MEAWEYLERMVVRWGHGGAWSAWPCNFRMVTERGFDDSARNTGSTGERIAVRESAFFPIDIGVDPFEPRHSQNHLIGTEGSDKENFLVFDTTECELEDNDTVCMN